MTTNRHASICSLESEASPSPTNQSASEQSPIPKSAPTPAGCSSTGSLASQISATFELSATEFSTRCGALMSLQEAFLASLHRLSDRCAELRMSAGCGPKQSEWLAELDHDSSMPKTRQRSLLCKVGQHGMELLERWPRSGMIVGGMLFPLPPSVQGICESESCLSLPTPLTTENERGDVAKPRQLVSTVKAALLPTCLARDGKSGPDYAKATRDGAGGDDLVTFMAKRHFLPTAAARDYKDTPGMATKAKDGRIRDDQLPRRIYADDSIPKTGGMKMSPEFRCWFMGFPVDWLKPLVESPAMQSSPRRSGRSRKRSTKASVNG